MDLIRAYADQVASYHPARVRGELAAEIYANLSEEFEDWHSEHPEDGPARYLEETKAHPMKYATKLAEENSTWLIGPGFYFSFVAALKTGASIVVGLHFLLSVVVALASGAYLRSFIGTFAGLPQALLWVSAAILGVFVAIEKSGEGATWLDDWSAKDLKPGTGRQPIYRAETFFDLALSTLLLLWVLDIVQLPVMIRHDGAWIDNWSVGVPAWFWWVAGALLVFDIGFSIPRLFRSHWSTPLRWTTIVTNAFWIGMLLFAARRPELLQVAESMRDSLSDILPFVDKAARGILLVIAAVLAWEVVMHAWRLARRQ